MGLPAVENGTVNNGPITVTSPPAPKRKIDFWKDMPIEIKMEIFRKLSPTEIVRCSRVSKEWYRMCFDGQLWSSIDATDYYSQISGDALIKIITSGGPFIRDLNLRGCVQLLEKWVATAERLSDACRNIVSFTLEGCRVDKTALHYFLLRNPRLEFINVSGLSSVSNSAMKIIAQSCPFLETLIVSWCPNVDTKGLRRVVESCHRLKDLRAGEIRGFDDEGFMEELFKRNTLERLVVHRTDITDQSLEILIHGVDPEVDLLTDRPIVPPRNFKHLDLHQCSALTDDGVRTLTHNLPLLRGLQLSQCPELTDDSIVPIIQTTPMLTHLDLEELDNLTNNTLIELSKSPCVDTLEHLNVSSCENLGDSGMLPVLRNCSSLLTVVMDNTRISDLCLSDASNRIRKRGYSHGLPRVGLKLVVFDCVNVTWAGIKEVLSNNAHPPRSLKNATPAVTVKTHSPADACHPSPTTAPSVTFSPVPQPAKMFPKEIIELKCFYGWQMTVDEHTKRVLRGDLTAAARLDRKWAEYMMATEEAGVGGAGARRRRRRAREAERLYNDDEEDGNGSGGFGPLGGRRRRARSGGCNVM
jgi:F-box/leucine-rich repeat protein 2/20